MENAIELAKEIVSEVNKKAVIKNIDLNKSDFK